MTDQLVQHLADEEKWLKNPYGFNYLATNDDGFGSFGGVAPPAGYERLPMHEEVTDGE